MRKAFTLIELLLVFGIMIALGAIVFANLGGKRTSADVAATGQEVATVLRRAQTDAVEQENGVVQGVSVSWGVHFANVTGTAPFYALFAGTYSPTTTVGYYPLPSTVSYQTSTLAAGATLDVIFSPITGVTPTATVISFYMPKENAAFSSTISVATSGAVSY